MRKIIPLLLITSLFFSCNKLSDFIPHPSTPEFSKVYGGSKWDQANSISATLDGGYIFAGYTSSNDGDVNGNHGGSYDEWVVKLDKAGNKLWQKTLGGSGDDKANSITTTLDGGYVIAGVTASNDGDVSGFRGEFDVWVVKLDKDGKIIWQKTFGGSDFDYVNAIIATTDGGYVMAGTTGSHDGDLNGYHEGGDAWVVRLDKDGNKVWQKTFGGSKGEQANAITATLDGGYIIAGYTGSNDGDVSGFHGYLDAWVVKLDKDGNKLWQKALGGSGVEQANAITATLDGGYVIGGYTSSNDGDVSGFHGEFDAWIVKLDKDGKLMWQKALGGTGDDAATSIITTLEESYVMAGYTYSKDGDVSGNHGFYDAWIVKLDKAGNKLWQKTLGSSANDVASSIITRPDGGYIMAGYASGNDGDINGFHGSLDAWVKTLKDQ